MPLLARLWVVLLATLLVLPTPAQASPSRSPSALASPGVGEAGLPMIGADLASPASDLRTPEGTRALTVVAREVEVDVVSPDAAEPNPDRGRRARERDASGWCDLVQCRRWSGAQLLRYATPPPARS